MKTKTKQRKRRTEDNKNLKNEHIPFLQGAVKIYGIAVRRKLPVSIAYAPLGNQDGLGELSRILLPIFWYALTQ